MKYVLSPQAGADLESIYEYTITKWGVEHHYIAYRVREEVVEIGRVLHESMHFEAQVSNDDFQFE